MLHAARGPPLHAVSPAARHVADRRMMEGLRWTVRGGPLWSPVLHRLPGERGHRPGLLVTEADVETVGVWLLAGVPDGGTLPDRLLLRVSDGIQHDVGDVLVGEDVLDLPGLAPRGHDAGRAQDAEVLGDERLTHSEGGDQLVDVLP